MVEDDESYEYLLKLDNLFSLGPAEKEKMWADKKELKQKLDRLISVSLATSPTKLFIYYGDYGSGKTHSMRYFTNYDNLKKLVDKEKVEMPIAINLVCPRNQVFTSFYKRLVEELWLDLVDAIIKIGSEIKEPKYLRETGLTLAESKSLDVSVERVEEKLREYIDNRNLSKVLAHLAIQDSERRLLVERYLLLTTSRATEFNKLGVPRGIETNLDMLETLKNIINLLINFYKLNTRIILWVDETEYVFKLPAKEILDLQSFLRDLTDHIPQHLLIILNVSLKHGEEVQDFISYLGEPIERRISRIIRPPEITLGDGIEYIRDYLKSLGEDPFEENTIEKTVSMLAEEAKDRKLALTPGLINKAISYILESAYFDKKDKITHDFIESIEDDLVSTVFPRRDLLL